MPGNLVASVILGIIALVFFVAERSLSFFSWSMFEELSVPRSRRLAAEKCLEERELVSVCFLVLGGAAVAAFSVCATTPATWPWPAAFHVAVLALVIIWLLPELLAWRLKDKVVLYVVPLLYRLSGVPFRLVRGLFGHPASQADTNAPSPETEPDVSAVDAEAHEFLRTAVRIKHMPVREIMTPRTDMVGMPHTTTLRRAAELSRESGYSRFPVYRGNRDQIVGIVLIKELLAFAGTPKWSQGTVADLVREPFFLPETKAISELMEEFQRSKTHMGIVLDEYGGTAGLVTLEDVVEELIGEIHDEHEVPEEEEPPFTWVDERTVVIQAVVHIEQVNEEFNLDLPEEEDFDTLGGFVLFMLGKIPVEGDSFESGGARFTVAESDPRRVIRVRVEFKRPPPPREKG